VPSAVGAISATLGAFGGHAFGFISATTTTASLRVFYNSAPMTTGSLTINWWVFP
jgi:hypothetical protein